MKSTPLYPAMRAPHLVLRGDYVCVAGAGCGMRPVPSRLLRCHCSNAPEAAATCGDANEEARTAVTQSVTREPGCL